MNKRNPEISFHSFPQEGKEKVYIHNKLNIRELVDRRAVWVMNLKLGKPVSKYMKVCSRHFKKDDYFYRTGMYFYSYVHSSNEFTNSKR